MYFSMAGLSTRWRLALSRKIGNEDNSRLTTRQHYHEDRMPNAWKCFGLLVLDTVSNESGFLGHP